MRSPKPSWVLSPAAVLLMSFACAAVSAQTVGERQGRQAAFLPVNARSAALGDASGALLGGIEGAASNPGVLAWLAGPRVEYTFHRLSPAGSLQHLAAGFRSGASSGLGLHLDLLHYGGYDFFSRGEIRDRGFELNGGVTYSTMFTDDLAGGVTVSALNATTDADPVWALSADAGITYMPGRYHRFGLAFTGWGTDYDIAQPVLPPEIPDNRPSRTISLSAVFDYPLDAGGQHLILAFQNDKMMGRTGLLYKAGIEYRLFRLLALRGGVQVRGGDVEPRGGLGITIGPLSLDYAYRYRTGTIPAHTMTLSFGRD